MNEESRLTILGLRGHKPRSALWNSAVSRVSSSLLAASGISFIGTVYNSSLFITIVNYVNHDSDLYYENK
jgi:hypothetical protein